MADALIDLDTEPPEPDRRRAGVARWLVAAVAALAVLAALAITIGGRGRPRPPLPDNYVSSPGFSLYVRPDGDAAFIIAIHNFSANPVVVSKPAVTMVSGVSDVHVILTRDEPTPPPGWFTTWPVGVAAVTIPPFGDAHLTVGYHVECVLSGRKGPFAVGATIQAVAGSVRSIRNVMPVLNPAATYGVPYCPVK